MSGRFGAKNQLEGRLHKIDLDQTNPPAAAGSRLAVDRRPLGPAQRMRVWKGIHLTCLDPNVVAAPIYAQLQQEGAVSALVALGFSACGHVATSSSLAIRSAARFDSFS